MKISNNEVREIALFISKENNKMFLESIDGTRREIPEQPDSIEFNNLIYHCRDEQESTESIYAIYGS